MSSNKKRRSANTLHLQIDALYCFVDKMLTPVFPFLTVTAKQWQEGEGWGGQEKEPHPEVHRQTQEHVPIQ